MDKNIRSVATHFRDFHADDVFAVAILKMLFPKIKVYRVEYRDTQAQQKADVRVDIGRKYDARTLDFDHHQPEGAGIRSNGISYASCGLVWKHFGRDITKDETIYEEIDKKIIQTLDAIDNGIEISEVKIIRPYTISDYIFSLNPSWPDENLKNFDARFEVAVEFAMHVLRTEIEKIRKRLLSEKELMKYIDLNKSKDYLIIYESLPWQEYVINKTKYKYVIKYDEITDVWNINAVPMMTGSFDTRHSFPMAWAGLSGKSLEEKSGINGAIFCHKGLFFAVAKTKEAAIEMVEKSIGRKNG